MRQANPLVALVVDMQISIYVYHVLFNVQAILMEL